MTSAVATGWIIGWAIGFVVTVVAASLLLLIIGLGRRITRQAQAITTALDGARDNTDAIFDVARTNLGIARITRALRKLRTGAPS